MLNTMQHQNVCDACFGIDTSFSCCMALTQDTTAKATVYVGRIFQTILIQSP